MGRVSIRREVALPSKARNTALKLFKKRRLASATLPAKRRRTTHVLLRDRRS